MTRRLTKDELEKKMKFHDKKSEYYRKKIKKIDKERSRIGFIKYD